MALRALASVSLALALACSAPGTPTPGARGESRDESRAPHLTVAPATPKTAPSAAARKPDAWLLHERPEDGFAISLPPGWRIEPPLPQDDPALRLIALELGTDADPDGVRAVVQVLKFRLRVGFTFETLTQTGTAPFEQAPTTVGPVTQRLTRLQVGPALETHFREKRMSSRGMVVAAVTHYEVLRGDTGYVLMLFALTDAAKDYAPTFAKIAEGFQFR